MKKVAESKANTQYQPTRVNKLKQLLEQNPNNKQLQEALTKTAIKLPEGKVDFSIAARVNWKP